MQYLLAGMFGRACRAGAGGGDSAEELVQEVASMRKLLEAKMEVVAETLQGSFPAVREHLWLGEEDGEAVASALAPKLRKNRKAVEQVGCGCVDSLGLRLGLRAVFRVQGLGLRSGLRAEFRV